MIKKKKRWARQEKRRDELHVQASFGMAYRVTSMKVMREVAAAHNPAYRAREFVAK